jgi:tubulin-specific chaperone B
MMTGADIAQLKAYVQGPDSGIQNRDAATVLLHVSHSNLAARFMEIRVDMHVSQKAASASVACEYNIHLIAPPHALRKSVW